MVVAWSSAARLKGQAYEVREIGRQLNVSTALVGSVRRSGERLRVMAQLIDTENGRYLWSETYDRQMQDLFAIQEEISRAIVTTLKIKLMDRPGAPAIRQGAYNLEAYTLYLKGRFQWNKRTAEGLKRGVQFFEQAIAVDPAFAPAPRLGGRGGVAGQAPVAARRPGQRADVWPIRHHPNRHTDSGANGYASSDGHFQLFLAVG